MMIAAMALMSVGAFAQEAGKMGLGLNANYGIDSDYKNFGLGAKFQYSITDAFRAEVSGDYFFKKDYVSMWDANVNAHYVIKLSDNINLYPLVGFTVMGVKFDYSDDIENEIEMAAKEAGMSVSDYKKLAKQYGYDLSEYEDEASDTETKVGFNAGAGIEFFLSDSFKINAEFKYQYVKDFDRPVISIGAAYVF